MSVSSWSARYSLNVRVSITNRTKRVNVDEAGVATVYTEQRIGLAPMGTAQGTSLTMGHFLCGTKRRQRLPAPHRYGEEVVNDMETKLLNALQTAQDEIKSVRDHEDGTM